MTFYIGFLISKCLKCDNKTSILMEIDNFCLSLNISFAELHYSNILT